MKRIRFTGFPPRLRDEVALRKIFGTFGSVVSLHVESEENSDVVTGVCQYSNGDDATLTSNALHGLKIGSFLVRVEKDENGTEADVPEEKHVKAELSRSNITVESQKVEKPSKKKDETMPKKASVSTKTLEGADVPKLPVKKLGDTINGSSIPTKKPEKRLSSEEVIEPKKVKRMDPKAIASDVANSKPVSVTATKTQGKDSIKSKKRLAEPDDGKKDSIKAFKAQEKSNNGVSKQLLKGTRPTMDAAKKAENGAEAVTAAKAKPKQFEDDNDGKKAKSKANETQKKDAKKAPTIEKKKDETVDAKKEQKAKKESTIAKAKVTVQQTSDQSEILETKKGRDVIPEKESVIVDAPSQVLDVWEEYMDDQYACPYYFNPVTNITTWDPPPSGSKVIVKHGLVGVDGTEIFSTQESPRYGPQESQSIYSASQDSTKTVDDDRATNREVKSLSKEVKSDTDEFAKNRKSFSRPESSTVQLKSDTTAAGSSIPVQNKISPAVDTTHVPVKTEMARSSSDSRISGSPVASSPSRPVATSTAPIPLSRSVSGQGATSSPSKVSSADLKSVTSAIDTTLIDSSRIASPTVRQSTHPVASEMSRHQSAFATEPRPLVQQSGIHSNDVTLLRRESTSFPNGALQALTVDPRTRHEMARSSSQTSVSASDARQGLPVPSEYSVVIGGPTSSSHPSIIPSDLRHAEELRLMRLSSQESRASAGGRINDSTLMRTTSQGSTSVMRHDSEPSMRSLSQSSGADVRRPNEPSLMRSLSQGSSGQNLSTYSRETNTVRPLSQSSVPPPRLPAVPIETRSVKLSPGDNIFIQGVIVTMKSSFGFIRCYPAEYAASHMYFQIDKDILAQNIRVGDEVEFLVGMNQEKKLPFAYAIRPLVHSTGDVSSSSLRRETSTGSTFRPRSRSPGALGARRRSPPAVLSRATSSSSWDPRRAIESMRWERFVDHATGRPYWYMASTKETTWDDPYRR